MFSLHFVADWNDVKRSCHELLFEGTFEGFASINYNAPNYCNTTASIYFPVDVLVLIGKVVFFY